MKEGSYTKFWGRERWLRNGFKQERWLEHRTGWKNLFIEGDLILMNFSPDPLTHLPSDVTTLSQTSINELHAPADILWWTEKLMMWLEIVLSVIQRNAGLAFWGRKQRELGRDLICGSLKLWQNFEKRKLRLFFEGLTHRDFFSLDRGEGSHLNPSIHTTQFL